MRGIKKYHPLAGTAFFLAVMLITAFIQSPYFVAVSLIFSVLTALNVSGKKVIKLLLITLPFFIISCGINLLFNNAGVTVLFYLPTGNAATLETLIYSVNAGGMLISLVMWFACVTEIMTSDKIVYLFGSIAPRLGLLISMILRFVPLLVRRIKETAQAQKFVGCDIYGESVLQRVKNALRVLSVAIAASAEGAAQTAASMKGRGYGLKGVRRTSYTVYGFAAKEAAAVAVVLAASALIIAGACAGWTEYHFYPDFATRADGFTLITLIAWAVLCALPLVINIYESGVRRLDTI
ncbi:MAG: cobalt transporter [Eubacterium sp.]|nr:cobalt transporter [Eubacterium sp.]